MNLSKTANRKQNCLYWFRLTFYLVGLTILLITEPLYSQTAKNLHFGLKAGFNVGNAEGDDASGLGSRECLSVGGIASMELRNGFMIELNLLYSQKGAEGSVYFDGFDLSATIKNDYIEIPLLIKYRIINSQKSMPYIAVGPSIAFNISSKTNLKLTEGNQSFEMDLNNYNEKKTDFGIVAGAGTEVLLKKHKLIFDARYTWGLSDMWNDVTPGSVSDQTNEVVYIDENTGEGLKMKNGTLSISVGFLF